MRLICARRLLPALSLCLALAISAASDPTPAQSLTPTRSLHARSNRHALVIGIGRYADPAITELPGVKFDRASATQMAHSMQVPESNITYLQDEQATGEGIRRALQALNARVQEGDRVFIHYSGHGTRYLDAASGNCTEALLAYEGGQSALISNHEMATLLSGITQKTDKLFVVYDACHSGGIAQTALLQRTRSISTPAEAGVLRPKFVTTSAECARPVNVITRGLVAEASATGAQAQDIIYLSASRANEISFDDETKGGLATQYLRDCMLRDARDADKSGSISMEEIRQCAQQKLDKRMAGNTSFKPPNLVLSGNTEFVPAWFSQAALASVSTSTQVQAQVAAVAASVATPADTPAATPVSAAVAGPTPAPVSAEQALQQVFAQRDAKHMVQVFANQKKLRIGRDTLDFSVQSDKAGYVYVALAGSDDQSFYLLFPNAVDGNNKISAWEELQLPRPSWRVTASGPAGTDRLLILVSDAPRDLSALAANRAGPFTVWTNDAKGRAQLGAMLTSAKAGDTAQCEGANRSKALCSDAFGAAMLSLEEAL